MYNAMDYVLNQFDYNANIFDVSKKHKHDFYSAWGMNHVHKVRYYMR